MQDSQTYAARAHDERAHGADERHATPGPAIPAGFVPIGDGAEAFLKTAGPIYARRNDAGLLDLGFHALQRHANRFGFVHGGMLATLVDYAVGVNLLDAENPVPMSTISLNIDFIGAARIGQWLQTCVQVDKAHGRVRFCSCAMHDGDGLLVLRASGVFSAALRSK
jgi:uncharacterized protein (TIGR00369 family)